MMMSTKNVANAVGAKTARPCDSCMKKRARCYCAADDAFLCQSCDSSVHSANPLARRHERVRLKTASSSLKPLDLGVTKKKVNVNNTPSWHKGFTRKARTPRGKHGTNHSSNNVNPLSSLVPEVGCDEVSNNEENYNEEEQLLYRVPIFDPFVAELCSTTPPPTTTTSNSPPRQPPPSVSPTTADVDVVNESKERVVAREVESLHGSSPADDDMDHAEFAADVESLLGGGLESESIGMEELGFTDISTTPPPPPKEEGDRDHVDERADDDQYDSKCTINGINGCLLLDIDNNNGEKVKLEQGEVGGEEEEEEEKKRVARVCISEEPITTFELGFDDDDDDYNNSEIYNDDSPHNLTCNNCGKGHNNIYGDSGDGENYEENKNSTANEKKRKVLLSLDYDGVIAAWASQGSPWTGGDRPDFDPDDCWPNCMGTCGIEFHSYMNWNINDGGAPGGRLTMAGDGGREARVSRYREKRRTRLFSKKIRYEVRKLNAEKRPRMKGRFVKRATTANATLLRAS